MKKIIIAISNHLPDSKNRLNNFTYSFTVTVILFQFVSALVLCNIFKNAGKIVNICLYELIVLLFIISLTLVFNKAIKCLSSSQNTLSVLSNKEQVNYDKQLLTLDNVKWSSIWTFMGIVVVVTTFDYTVAIPILFGIICIGLIVSVIMKVDD